MPARHWSIGHSRRLSHSAIAATPWERVPSCIREEAVSLLDQGSPAIIRRLGTPSAKLALRCQGVKLDHIVHAADVMELDEKRCVTPLPGERKRRLASVEHARQLLAQVLWEEALCKGLHVDDEPPPFVDTEPPGRGLLEGSRRPQPTQYPLSRPQSARCARMEKWENTLDNRHRNLQDRLSLVATAREQRARHFQHISDVRHEQTRQGEGQIAAFQQDKASQLADYGRGLSARRSQHHKEQAARLAADAASYTRAMRELGVDRADRALHGRLDGLHERDQHQLELCLESCGRRHLASERRAVQRGAKTVQQVQQATSRKLQQYQMERIDNLRQGEQACLRQVLDAPTVFSHQRRYD